MDSVNVRLASGQTSSVAIGEEYYSSFARKNKITDVSIMEMENTTDLVVLITMECSCDTSANCRAEIRADSFFLTSEDQNDAATIHTLGFLTDGYNQFTPPYNVLNTTPESIILGFYIAGDTTSITLVDTNMYTMDGSAYETSGDVYMCKIAVNK